MLAVTGSAVWSMIQTADRGIGRWSQWSWTNNEEREMLRSRLITVAAATVLIAGCQASSPPSNDLSGGEVRSHQFGCLAGTVGGAVIGGLAGSMIGGGTGQLIATGVGAAAGGVLGNELACPRGGL